MFLSAIASVATGITSYGQTFRVQLGENKPEIRRTTAAGGSGTAASASRLAILPENLRIIAMQLLPAEGEITRANAETRNGETLYHVQKTLDGLDHEIWLTPDGRLARREVELRPGDLPPAVTAVANSTLPGFSLDVNSKPTLHERDGMRFYEVRVRPQGGGRGQTLRVTPEGTLLRTN